MNPDLIIVVAVVVFLSAFGLVAWAGGALIRNASIATFGKACSIAAILLLVVTGFAL